MDVCGIVLAAGAGTRFGRPKVLVAGWLDAACSTLLAAGCTRVVVVLGAAPDAALPDDPRVSSVVAQDWSAGMSHSLRAGLAAVTEPAALITLVDLPGLPASVASRVLAADGPLRQAVFDGRPGHPVYVAMPRPALLDGLVGDHGARQYLIANGVTEVECGDLWSGLDVDEREP